MFAVVFPALFCISATAEGALFPAAGCTAVPVAIVLPVIAKDENPDVLAVKYKYLSSSPDRLTESWFHFLSLYLFRVIED